MLQQLLLNLARKAYTENTVAFTSLAGDVQILVYPMDQGILVGFGVEGELAKRVNVARILHKRAGDMSRFGSWLPARLKDGGLYVLKRVLDFNPNFPPLDQSDLDAAEELLN